MTVILQTFLHVIFLVKLLLFHDFSLQENKYNSLQDLEKDFATLVKNAHTFNEPGSQIYKVNIAY